VSPYLFKVNWIVWRLWRYWDGRSWTIDLWNCV